MGRIEGKRWGLRNKNWEAYLSEGRPALICRGSGITKKKINRGLGYAEEWWSESRSQTPPLGSGKKGGNLSDAIRYARGNKGDAIRSKKREPVAIGLNGEKGGTRLTKAKIQEH